MRTHRKGCCFEAAKLFFTFLVLNPLVLSLCLLLIFSFYDNRITDTFYHKYKKKEEVKVEKSTRETRRKCNEQSTDKTVCMEIIVSKW